MQDQVGALRRRGIRAAHLNSLLSPSERAVVLRAACTGRLRLLYCAPERLATLIPQLRAHGVRVGLLAVDEAHCVVEWGNEFRPVYRRLGQYRYQLGNPVTIALTGSATAATRGQILEVLRVPSAEVVLTSFDRPNLTFVVERVRDDRDRFARIRAGLRDVPGTTVVYAPTRRLTELIARALHFAGARVAPYHAGLSPEMRRALLGHFLEDRLRVVIATSAFGMGIDKADVRRVLHWGPAPSLEAYYQEAGRAGRDGAAAVCRLLWRPADFAWGMCDAAMRRYVESGVCRRRQLLAHFGEVLDTRCGGCDRCGT
jgi:ATP-dependent DNA helicase RecQ